MFSFFICGCQHHQRKTICLYVYISNIRQIVEYQTPVFIQRFPWRLHITITYNLPHLRLICWRCQSNSVNTGSRLPICSDVKTRKRRNVVGIDMIRNNRIVWSLVWPNRVSNPQSSILEACTQTITPLIWFHKKKEKRIVYCCSTSIPVWFFYIDVHIDIFNYLNICLWSI